MDEENDGEQMIIISDEQVKHLQGHSATCEPSDQEQWQHTWIRGTAPGWYICARCAREAICPECLPNGAKQPKGAIVKQCLRHTDEEAIRGKFQ